MARKDINNTFYDDLGQDWHEATNHPIALLRSENALRNPWIHMVIREKYGENKVSALDIGCGAGLLTNFLASFGHRVSGIDLSEGSLKIAKEKDITASVNYTAGSAYDLPYENESFDIVCAMDLLEHVDNPEKVIEEASRVLKKGGLFFFHTFSRNFLSWLVVIKGVEWCVRNTPPNMHVYSLFLNPSEVEDMCKANDLVVEKFTGVRPDFQSLAFWKMLLTHRVDDNFRFTFTRSLTTGYSGYAVKS